MAVPAAELIANNVDLLTEILLRLPAKSTIQFKSVSKHWLSLLSDSQFPRNHCFQNPRVPSTSGFYFNNEENITFVSFHGRCHNLPDLSFLGGLEGRFALKLEDSCNGLLLLSCFTSDPCFKQYAVCNPTTKKYTLLPKPVYRVVKRFGGCLVFDPSKSPLHYEVVSLARGYYQIDIYSSRSRCWRKVDVSHENLCVGRGVFWNGGIHWLTYDGFLKRFDVDAEEIMLKPHVPAWFSWEIMYFGECGGGLVLIQCSYSRSKIRILELKRDYSVWVVKCEIDLKPLISSFLEIHRSEVLCAMGAESERVYVLSLAIPGRIISYNLKKKTWDVLHDQVPLNEFSYGYASYSYEGYALPFIETLFPV